MRRQASDSTSGASEGHVHGPDCAHDPAPRQPIRRAEPKVGRNDPCPCGSGKKYKKCHGGSSAEAATG